MQGFAPVFEDFQPTELVSSPVVTMRDLYLNLAVQNAHAKVFTMVIVTNAHACLQKLRDKH